MPRSAQEQAAVFSLAQYVAKWAAPILQNLGVPSLLFIPVFPQFVIYFLFRSFFVYFCAPQEDVLLDESVKIL